jgi:hypothetical protein
MYTWGETEIALDALDPIRHMTPEQVAKLEFFSKIEAGKTGHSSLRHWVANALLKVAVALDPAASRAMAAR